MIILVLISAFVATTTSSGIYPVYGVTVGLSPYSHPVQSQYHAQDIHGQYVYGYATPTSTKTEAKTADGVTRGGYSYIDSNGILQTVEYVADPIHGFRVAATNLPQDLPDVAYAKAKHLAQYEAIKAEHLSARTVAYSNPIAVPISAVPQVAVVPLPQPVQDLPEVIKARAEHLALVESIKARDAGIAIAQTGAYLSPIPNHLSGVVVPVHTAPVVAAPTVVANSAPIAYSPLAYSTQYQSQDGHGQYSYGYTDSLSSKAEAKTADGVTRGGYSYIDANGILQTVHYISDPVNGFRVAATNLPVGPENHVEAPVVKTAIPVAKSYGLYSHDVYY